MSEANSGRSSFNDGELTEVKIAELVSLRRECEELDYKVIIDFRSQSDLIEITKDIIAFANCLGGYILIGVDNSYNPVGLPDTFHFDSADIQQRIERYCSPRVAIDYAEMKVKIGDSAKKYCLLFVEESPELVVTKIEGVYTEMGKTHRVFSKDDVFVRKGSRSEKPSDSDYRMILRRKKFLSSLEKGLPEQVESPNIPMQNIPRQDYSEFIGRKEVISDIISKLKGRYFVVSIDGIGGVGKTALAHQVATKCWDEGMFGAVIWVSAKSRRLTLTGIDDLVPSLASYDDLLNTILLVLGFSSQIEKKVEQRESMVQDLLSNTKCLLVVDNLETITDEKVFNFIKELPEPSKALTTSRKRLGEVEKVVRLEKMSLDEAKELIRGEAELKDAEVLLHANTPTLEALYKVTGGIPLAIKWVVGWISSGEPLDYVLRKLGGEESPVLEFCFKEVFQNIMSGDARTVLSVMPIFTEECSRDQIGAASGLSGDKLDIAIGQLVILSLLNQKVKEEADRTQSVFYDILPLTLSFAQVELAKNRGLEKDARKRLGEFYQSRQQMKEASEQYGYALEDQGATSDKGRAAALLANLAFAAYQRGNYGETQELFKRAVKTNPYLSYVYQLWAFVERQEGNYGRADELFDQATKLNPNNSGLWRTWSSMKREIGAIEEARKIALKGFDKNPNDPSTLHNLAVSESQAGNYEKADQLFDRVLLSSSRNFRAVKQNVMTYGAKSENLRKWGNNDEERELIPEARKKYELGLANVEKGLALKPNFKLFETRTRLNRNLGELEFRNGNFDSAIEFLKNSYLSPRAPWQSKHNAEVSFVLAKSLEALNRISEAIEVSEKGLRYWEGDIELVRLREKLSAEMKSAGRVSAELIGEGDDGKGLLTRAAMTAASPSGLVRGAKLASTLRALDSSFTPQKYGAAKLADFISMHTDVLLMVGERKSDDPIYLLSEALRKK